MDEERIAVCYVCGESYDGNDAIRSYTREVEAFGEIITICTRLGCRTAVKNMKELY